MSSQQERINRLHRVEPIVFLLLLAIHLLVLFRHEWYPTLDGPAHLYNAHLIKQLLLGNDHLAQFLEFSSFAEPNWSGHAIMAFLSLFLPANLVEKGLVALIFIGTALAFRSLARAHHGQSTIASLLIFPFLCTHTLRIGFFNFSISVLVLLLVLNYWIRTRGAPSPMRILGLSLLIGVLYFSNALTTLIGIGGLFLFTVIGSWKDPDQRKSRSIALVIASLPWLVLIALFLLRGKGQAITSFLPGTQLWTMLRDGSTFTFQNGTAMIMAARVIVVCLIGMAIIALFKRFSRKATGISITDVWLLLSAGALIAFFIMPDKAATGGIISIRFLLFFHLFLAIWLAAQQRWPILITILLVPYLIADLVLVRFDDRFTAELNKDVIEIRSALPHVRDEAIILPLVYSDNWLVSNFSNYLGTERAILVIDNYEAMTPHFPLRWKTGHRAPDMARSFYNSNRPCIGIDALGDSIALRFDHVTRWEFRSEIQDSCTADLNQQLTAGFEPKHRSPAGRMELFQRD